jgi:hypothetical protein
MAAAIVKGILSYQKLTAPVVPPPVMAINHSSTKPAGAAGRFQN